MSRKRLALWVLLGVLHAQVLSDRDIGSLEDGKLW